MRLRQQLPPDATSSISKQACLTSAESMDRMVRMELAIMKLLKDHADHFVPGWEGFPDEGDLKFGFSLELIFGQTLEELIHTHRKCIKIPSGFLS